MSKRKTKAEIYAIISDQFSSGQTQQGYCKSKGIQYQTYTYWLRRFKNEPDFPQRSKKNISSTFIPVEIEAVPTIVSNLKIDFPNNVSVSLEADLNSLNIEQLKKLLQCLD